MDIKSFFSGKNIFLTGGTGFIGKVLVEKLLRTFPDIGTIYVLIRSKKGKTPQERLEQVCQNVVRNNKIVLYDIFVAVLKQLLVRFYLYICSM